MILTGVSYPVSRQYFAKATLLLAYIFRYLKCSFLKTSTLGPGGNDALPNSSPMLSC